jgi:hypothetical protein
MPKHEKPFRLDMPFDEALRRYAQTDPRELTAEKKKPEKRKRKASSPSVTKKTRIRTKLEDHAT